MLMFEKSGVSRGVYCNLCAPQLHCYDCSSHQLHFFIRKSAYAWSCRWSFTYLSCFKNSFVTL